MHGRGHLGCGLGGLRLSLNVSFIACRAFIRLDGILGISEQAVIASCACYQDRVALPATPATMYDGLSAVTIGLALQAKRNEGFAVSIPSCITL